jgi:hypothetical protein
VEGGGGKAETKSATLLGGAGVAAHAIDLISASTIQEEQYLMLRILWKSQKYHKLDLAKFGLDE